MCPLFRTSRQQNGTTLIETIIALSILTAVALASLTGLRVLYDTLITVEQRTTAESMAKAQLEDVKRQTYIDNACSAPQYQSLDPAHLPADYSITLSATCIDGDGNETETDSGLQKITVTVIHAGRNILTLSGYKVQ